MARRTMDEAFRARSTLAALGGESRHTALEMARLRALGGESRLTESQMAHLRALERNGLAASEVVRLAALGGESRHTALEMARLRALGGESRLAASQMGLYDTGELIRYHEERRIFIDRIKNSDSLLGHIREEQYALASSRRPTIEETLRLSKIATKEFNAGLGSVASIRQEELRSLAERISTPWVDKFNALSSFKGAALLLSIGNVLRGELFDPALLQNMLSGSQAHESFFRDHGFDPRPTAIPEPAFTELLDETGISHPDLFPPIPPPPEEPEAKESENDDLAWQMVRQRNLDAYDILFSLETRLREYLHGAMTDHYGPKWEKQEVSNKLYQEWETKRATAIEKGGEERPLLWYADFTDYIDIICQRNNWRDIFKAVFRNEVEIRASFQWLHPIRNSIMHIRGDLTKMQFLRLTVESHVILKAIGKLEDD